MPSDYIRRLHQRAFRDACRFLHIESGKRAVIGVAFSAAAIALIWLFGARDLALGEIVLKIVLTALVVLAFPFVYAWKFAAAPAKMQAEADATIKRLAQTRCTLFIDSLRLMPDSDAKNRNFWRMRIGNEGPATAENVRMTLRSAYPKITYGSWRNDYPYLVGRVGAPPNSVCRIIKDDIEDFEVVIGYAVDNGTIFIEGLDTKTHHRNPVAMTAGEKRKLQYDVKADNADSLSFTLALFIKDGAVMMERTS